MPVPTRTIAILAAIAVAACTTDEPTAPGTTELPTPHHAEHSRDLGRTPDINRQLVPLRKATAHFQNFAKAREAGYEQITPCWEHTSAGAMGYHYGRVQPEDWDLTVDLLDPELVMYEPGPGGQMTLVGMEYVVPKTPWDEAFPGTVPTLLGQRFHPHSSLPIYKLHIWLWRDNPTGLFSDWNPRVSCRHATETDFFE